MGLTGDFAKLKAARGKLNRRTGEQLLREAARRMGSDAVALVVEGIQEGTDVNGRPFEPLANPGGKGRVGGPLERSGRLARSIRWKLLGLGFSLKAVDYGVFQNYGTRRIPAREFFPEPGTLPKLWESKFHDTASALVDVVFQ